jgi:hypothetical protein
MNEACPSNTVVWADTNQMAFLVRHVGQLGMLQHVTFFN